MHNMLHHEVGVNNRCMYIGSIRYASQQPLSTKEAKICSGGACELWAGGDSLHHDHHREAEMASSSSLLGPEATPAGNSGRDPREILNSIVEMREAQISFASAMGHAPLIASLGSLEACGCESGELKTIGILGKHAGIGARVSFLIGGEHHLNDATTNAVPIRPKKVHVVSGSTLTLRKSKSKGGYQGPELATSEKLMGSSMRNTASFRASRPAHR